MKKDNLEEEQLEQLKKISTTGCKMLNMINLSLDMYRMEQGTYQFEPAPVDLVSVIVDIIEENSMLTMLRGVSVDIRLSDAPPDDGEQLMVKGEKLLLYSMIADIIKNAIEASPDDEQITVALNPGDPISIGVHSKGTVPEEIRETFFGKYVTAGKGGGTGLGTYSARPIAEAHGANVRLDSSDQDGTTVRHYLGNRRLRVILVAHIKTSLRKSDGRAHISIPDYLTFSAFGGCQPAGMLRAADDL